MRTNDISFPGIKVEKDIHGNIVSLNINLKECDKRIIKFFNKIGVIKERPLYNSKFVKMIKTQDSKQTKKIDIDELWK